MTTNPPVQPPQPKEPIKDGLATHNRRIGELIKDLGDEITALQRIEKSLKDAHDRLERHTSLMSMETQLIDQLLKRDSKLSLATDRPPLKALPIDAVADRVEEDLKRLVPPSFETKSETPIVMPITKR